MSAVAMKHFDGFNFKHSSTVEFIKHLKAAKFTEEQVEILAIRDEDRDNQLEQIFEFTAHQSAENEKLATSQNVEFLKLELKKDIEVVRLELKKDIEVTNQNLEFAKLELKKDIEVTNQNLEFAKLELKKDIEVVRLGLQKEIEMVRKEIAQASTKIIIWTSGLLGGFGLLFLSVLAKGFHWL